ncbi:MAG: hypothetical protein JNJ80_03175 [Gemmatimonadetes bacterium]|nr:hypothetical protein [Gemmatimonadota bacterium]
MVERELKAVVPDPARVRRSLEAAGAVRTFAGTMADRRFDRDGTLLARDEVLRVRSYQAEDGATRAQIGWKGPVTVADGYKLRPEHEIETPDAAAAEALLTALGYRPIHAIDRYVEYYRLDDAVVRIEWYPRMDPLIEVEGGAAAIERAVAATGIPRDRFTAESLVAFTARYRERTGSAPAVSLAELGADRPEWPAR